MALQMLFCKKNAKFLHLLSPFCTDKPISIMEETKKGKTREKSVPGDTSDECAMFEKNVIKQVVMEKEQDANLQSRVSKECRILFSGTSPSVIKCGPLQVETSLNLKKANNSDWLTYKFEDSKCPPAVQVPVQKSPDGPAKSPGIVKEEGGHKGDKSSDSESNRIIRQEPGKVLFAFVPEEWWKAFIPKTGVTGFGVLLFTFSTFLISKEYYILEHNYYEALGMIPLMAMTIKYLGPHTAKYLDKGIDAYEKSWNEGRENEKKMLEDSIMDELHLQLQSEGQQLLIDAKRENVLLQLEEEFRIRQMHVYNEVKNRLDYHVAVELVKKRIQHKNLVEYVTREVLKAITPEMQSKLIYYSIDQIVVDLDKDKNKK